MNRLLGGEIVPANTATIASDVDRLSDEDLNVLRAVLGRSKSRKTVAIYAAEWAKFAGWCKKKGFCPMPAEPVVVSLYCAQRAQQGAAYAYICRGLAAISHVHRAKNAPNPRKSMEVNECMQGLRRTIGIRQRQASPLLTEDIRAMVDACDACAGKQDVRQTHLQGLRNKAIILVGFLAAMRRSEIVGLNVSHVSFCDRGIILHVPRSKTDQEGRGTERAIPFCKDENICAARAMRAWLAASGIRQGPVFVGVRRGGKLGRPLHGTDVARIVKLLCARCGRDPATYSGHSLRAGLATQAHIDGVGDLTIMRQTGHTSRSTMDRYVRLASLWEKNVVSEMGLA